MDPKKVEIKNIGNKLVEENEENANKDMAKELENLNKITTTKEVQPIKIKEHDIELLKKEIPPPYVPKVKSNNDISNFSSYPDSDTPAPQIKKEEDPF